MFYKVDSGGPFYTVENSKHYLTGITSYGAKKCDDGIRFANLVYSIYSKNYDFVPLPFHYRPVTIFR
jgi:hypothetical protein